MALTLWSLFFDEDGIPDPAARQLEASPKFASLKQAVGHAGSPLWASARTAVGDGLRQMMSYSITDLAVHAWAKHQELRRLLDGASPEKIVLFDLGDHTITSRHRPRIDVTVAQRTVGSLEFDLKLSLTFKAGRLHIQNRRVMRFATGSCRAEGTLKLGEVELAAVRSREIDLPGAFDLKDGIPLPVGGDQ